MLYTHVNKYIKYRKINYALYNPCRKSETGHGVKMTNKGQHQAKR